jgi:hypothetical protein
MSLLSTGQLTALRKVAEQGMVTSVEILRRSEGTPDPSNDYGDDVLDYTETKTSRRSQVKGWLYSNPANSQDVDSGSVVTVNNYILRVPVGTDILTGDGVVIAGEQYTVTDTTRENTWKALVTCNLRKRQ